MATIEHDTAGVPTGLDDNAQLEPLGHSIWGMPGARLIDRAGQKLLPVGDDGFERAQERAVLVDKTMLIADVLTASSTVTCFCRPRRFGKTLNMTMLKAFFEIPVDGPSRASMFEGTELWDAEGGRFRAAQGAFPVVYLSLRAAKGLTWENVYGAIKSAITAEFIRHTYVRDSDRLSAEERLSSCASAREPRRLTSMRTRLLSSPVVFQSIMQLERLFWSTNTMLRSWQGSLHLMGFTMRSLRSCVVGSRAP